MSTATSYRITGGTITLTNAPEINLKLSFNDLNNLKSQTDLATNQDNTFLSTSSSLVTDMNHNSLVAILSTDALKVYDIYRDATQPFLRSITMDLNDGQLLLNFSEIVDIESLDITEFTIVDCCHYYNAPDTPAVISSGSASGSGSGASQVEGNLNTVVTSTPTPRSSLMLTNGSCDSSANPVIVCSLVAADLNELKRLPLCTSELDCCLVFTGDAIMDHFDNVIRTQFDTCGVNTTYIRDEIRPRLVQFTEFNLNFSTLTLLFNETVNASSVNVKKLTLQSYYYMPQMTFTLTGGKVISNDSTSVTIELTMLDVFEIQRQRGLCSEINNCWISLTDEFVDDMSGNSLIPVPPTDARPLVLFVEDERPPELVDFELNLSNNTVTLTFNEIVSVSSLDASAITFLSDPSENATAVRVSSGGTVSPDGLIITVNLSPDDTNRIRATDELGTSEDNTYISITSDLITDAVERDPNQVVAIPPAMALQIQENGLYADEVLPTLTRFSLNLNNDLLFLTFDKPVRVSSFAPTNIMLLSNPSNTPDNARNLTGGAITTETNRNGTAMFIMHLQHPADIRYLKLAEDLATTRDNTWISILPGMITDMSGNNVTEIAPTSALQATEFTADTTAVTLIDFTLDMDLGLLHLTFNDVINSSTLYAPGITIQNSRFIDNNNIVHLTSSSVTESPNDYFITINISTSDLNLIKLNDQLATGAGNTFVSMRAETFTDNFGVDIVTVTSHEALQTAAFINDTTAPILLNFTLDMNIGALILTFDETVRANTIVEEEITLLSGPVGAVASGSGSGSASGLEVDIPAPSILKLTGGNASSTDSTLITVFLTDANLNEIKRLTDLGTAVNNSYIAIGADLIMDMNSNRVAPINQASALVAREHIPDRTSPMLVAFTINLTSEELVLTFNETVRANTLMVSQFRVHGHPSAGLDMSRQLQDSYGSLNDSTIITISLNISDLNEIKRLTSVATSALNTYLTVTELAIRDMNGNLLTAVNNLNTSAFSPDTIDPELISFNLNLSSEILTLSFTETVDASTLLLSSFTFLSEDDQMANSTQYTLTGGTTIDSDSDVINVELTTADLNVLKTHTDLATSNLNTYIGVEPAAVRDMNNNPLRAIPVDEAIAVTVFSGDKVRPMIESYNLDLNTGILTISFSETVDVSTFEVEEIMLQNQQVLSNVTTVFVLTDSSNTNSLNGPVVVVELGESDLNTIKRLDTLAVGNDSTYLSFSEELVSDMSDNMVEGVSSMNALAVAQFTSDTNRPELVEFSLDINAGTLTLEFNETVRSQSLQVNAITLQSDSQTMGPLNALQLTNSYTVSPDNTSIVIQLSPFDLNNLKRLRNVATSTDNTYISITSNAIADMNNNSVLAAVNGTALSVIDFVPDETRPELTDFSLDMDTGMLMLTFSETVQSGTLNISVITLQSDANSTVNYTLTHGAPPLYSSVSDTYDDPILTVLIGSSDLNAIKKLFSLATTDSNTYLSITADGVRDMVGLQVEPANDLSVANYTVDSSMPELQRFSLDLSSEILSLTFDETVNVDTLNVSKLVIQSSANASQPPYIMLMGHAGISQENSTVVSVTIAYDDLNEIKLDTELAVGRPTTWLRILPGAIQDMALMPNLFNGTTQQVFAYTSDRVNPQLTSFYVDMNAGLLVVNFDEPVDVSTLNYTAFTLYSRRDRISSGSGSGMNTPLTSFTLTNGSTNSTNGLQLTIILTIDDLNAIKENEDLFTSNLTSYLSIESTAIMDMNSIPITPINPADAIRTTAYISDTTPPVLLRFDLDMDTGLLLLHFPETVDVSTTLFEGITIQRSSNVTLSTNRYMLTGGTLNMMDDGLTAFLQISHSDLNEIKQRRIALTNATTWLTLFDSSILDMSDQPVPMTVLPVSVYSSDITSPSLSSFSLNLNTGELALNFSETVSGFDLDVTAITLQDTPTGDNTFNHYTLTESSNVSSAYGPHVTVLIGLEDLNNIKALIELATDQNSTFVSISTTLVSDVFGNVINVVNSTSALVTTAFTADTTSPVLEDFDLDMDRKLLTLYFSETVNGSSLNVDEITIIAGQEEGLENYTLETSTTTTQYEPVIVVKLSDDDFNNIKLLLNLATGEDDTYLTLTSDAILDASNNPVTAISVDEAILVSNYTKDATRPQLLAFNLDMDSLTVTLFFSEAINVSSINFTAITLLRMPGLMTTRYMLTDGSTTSPNGLIVEVDITKEDEDNLKRLHMLASSPYNTFLSISPYLITDIDDLPVYERSLLSPLEVVNFTADSTPPTLLSFDLDLDSNILSLTFSETVNASTLDVTEILLQSEQVLGNETSYHMIVEGNYSLYNDPIIQIQLSTFDANEIRRLYNLATEDNNTFISIGNGTISDMVQLSVEAIYNSSAKMVDNFVNDSVRPVVTSFSLDLTTEQLVLNFSETVNINTVELTQITLSGVSSSSSYTLTGGVVVNRDHTPSLTIELSTPDLNAIKFDTDLAVGMESTRLTITAAAVEDMNKNRVVPITSPLLTSQFTADAVPPTLVTFDLNLNTGVLTLTFSETVNAMSFDATQVTLLPFTNATDEAFTFSSESVTYSPNGTVLNVNISLNDQNTIKQLQTLAVDNNSTLLSLTNETVEDMNGNAVQSVVQSEPTAVTMFTADTTEPKLLSFTLDLTEETLTLSFSETVNASSINVTGITIQSELDSQLVSVTLTEANVSIENDPEVTLQLSQFDLNRIKDTEGLATSSDDTFISVESFVVADMSNNSLTPIMSTAALGNGTFIEDMTSPSLVSFELDINYGLLRLTFSESVNSSSIDSTELTIQSSQVANNLTSMYSLMDDSSVPVIELSDGVVLVFTLTESDLNNIKQIVTLATNESDTFITITSDFITDQSDNLIVPINTTQGLPAKLYIADTNCTLLESVMFDLNSGQLHLTFTEPVNTTTFNEKEVTLLNSEDISTVDSHVLTSAEYIGEQQYTRFMTLNLSAFDTDTIKTITDLATSSENTYIWLSPSAVMDTTGNLFCNTTTAMKAFFTGDNTPPQLVSFSLNMDTQELRLTFSESVQHHLLDPKQITLQAGPLISLSSSGSGSSSGMQLVTQDSFTLTGGSTLVNSSEPHVVILNLTDYDTDNIKHNTMLGVSNSSTYLAITETTVADYSNNSVVAIGGDNPLITSFFVPDMTQPSLVQFRLDMDNGVLMLSFTEVISIDTLNISGLTLQSNPGASSLEQYTLQNATVSFVTLTNIRVELSDQDVNAIKKLTSLATFDNNTYASINSFLVSDTVGLPVVAISAAEATQAFLYSVDESSPQLVCFSLNLTSEILSLTFDETVDASSVLVNQFALQSAAISPATRIHLTTGMPSPDDSTVIDIKLSDYDLHRIKWESDLATELNNTCISISAAALFDLAQPAQPIKVTVQCAKEFIPDSVPPQLDTFTVYLNQSQLILNFDEPVNISSVNLTLLLLQNTFNSSQFATESVILTGGNTTQNGMLQILVTITNDDLNEIKKNLNLLRNRDSSYISIPADFAVDLNNNPIVAIDPTSALKAAMFYDDDGRPILQGFDLDMDSGTLTLSFSETVDISTFDLAGIGLQLMSTVDLTVPTLHYQLMLGMVVSPSDTPVVRVLLNNTDLNELKSRRIGETDSVWITMTETTISDIVGLPVQEVNQANSIKISGRVPDTSSPQLLSFRIDMDASTLTLSFNETVEASTLMATGITLTAHPNATSGNLSYTLSASSITTSPNISEIVVKIHNDDLNILKQRTELATSLADTYIFLSSDTINDTFGNMVTELLQSEAIQATEYTRDATGPRLQSFELDMDTGILTVSFSETVNSSTLNTGGITLYNMMTESTQFYQLSMAYDSVSEPAPEIKVMLTNDDLNEIKILQQLATSRDNTYMIMLSTTIRDMDNNTAFSSSVTRARAFQRDLTPPELVSFVADMDEGHLILNFTESVLVSSVKFDYFAVRSNETLPLTSETVDRHHRLKDGSVLTTNGPSLTIQVNDDPDLNEIKRKDVCTIQLREEDCYIAIRTGGLTDMNNNEIQSCREV